MNRNNIKVGKEAHDLWYNSINDSSVITHPPKLRAIPYSLETDAEFVQNRQEKIKEYDEEFQNMMPEKTVWFRSHMMANMKFYYRDRIRTVCEESVSLVCEIKIKVVVAFIYNYSLFQFERPPLMTKTLTCINMHHNDPYLKLGPFKFELLHSDPEIAVFHQLISVGESEDVKNLARGNLRSTPYIVNQKNEKFSKKRTSKVMYMNENLVKEAMVVSKKIEMATRFRLSYEKFASENFQVMNYGIGGKIDAHVDASGEIHDANGTFCTY